MTATKINSKPKYVPTVLINLQHFAEPTAPAEPQQQAQQQATVDPRAQAMQILTGGQPQGNGQAPSGQPTTEPADGNPQQQPSQGQEPNNNQPAQGQPSQQQAPQASDLILGKFKSPEDLANAYVNLEQLTTKTSQSSSEKDKTIEALQTALEQMKSQINSVVNPQQQQQQSTPEELNQKIMDKLYENPSQLFDEIKQQAKNELLQELQPNLQYVQQMQKQSQWNQAIDQFAQAHQDFGQWQGAMSEIINKMPELANMPNGLEVAYGMAKGQNYQDPNSILQNQDFIKNNILNNQDIKNQIIQEYLQGVQQGNKAPTVIAGQVGGQSTATPPMQPQTIKDARNIALEYLKK